MSDVQDHLRWDRQSRKKEGHYSHSQSRVADIVPQGCCRSIQRLRRPALRAVMRANRRAGRRAEWQYVPAQVGELLVDALESHGVVWCVVVWCGVEVWSSSECLGRVFEEEKWAGCKRVSALILPEPLRRGRGRISGRCAPATSVLRLNIHLGWWTPRLLTGDEVGNAEPEISRSSFERGRDRQICSPTSLPLRQVATHRSRKKVWRTLEG